MSVHLDLSVHSIEEIEGKLLIINGVEYIICEQIGEGGESWVHLLENSLTKEKNYVVKLYKFKSDSEAFDKIRVDMPTHTMFRHAVYFLKGGFKTGDGGIEWSLSESPSNEHPKLHVSPIEIYEMEGGGVIRFQPFLPISITNNDLQHCKDLCKKCTSPAETEEAFDSLFTYLSKNPLHTEALYELSCLFFKIDDLGEALSILYRILELDRNICRTYLKIADIFDITGRPFKAIEILITNLDRYIYNFDTLSKLIDIVLNYDMVGLANSFLTKYLHEINFGIGEFKFFTDFDVRADAAEKRKASFDNLIENAKDSYDRDPIKCATYLRSALTASKNNFVALFNLQLIKYHSGAEENLSESFFDMADAVVNVRLVQYALLMGLITSKEDDKRTLANYINQLIHLIKDLDKFSMPNIPYFYTDTVIREVDGSERLLSELASLRRRYPELESLDSLIDIFENNRLS